MQVIKRNGQKQDIFFDKIANRIKFLCDDEILKDLNYIIVAKKTIEKLYPLIKTHELDILSSRIAASMSTFNPLYGVLASRICISNLHKMTVNNFYECCKILKNNEDCEGNLNPLINDEVFDIIERNHHLIQKEIDYKRDNLIDFFGFKTLERAYLLKVNNHIVERPQHMWMRVAVSIHREDIISAIETYHLLSQKYFTHASPTLFNAGTRLEQLSSCFLTGTSDDLPSIYKTITNCAYISKTAGGVGIHISNIRSSGSLIRSTNGVSDGIVPMLQVYNYTARYINQGGRRPGSFAIYLEPWHNDVFQFLDLRKNTGSETERARDLFLALWIPDLFMEKVKNNDDWYLMCPDESKGLNDVYGDDFNKLYLSYISKNKYKQKIKARKLWNKIIESQIETGTPYILYKDHVNRKSNQKNLGTIKSSNLCCEIVEYSDEKETAVCNLTSIAVNMFVKQVNLNGSKIKIYSKTSCVFCKLSKMLLKNINKDYEEILLDDMNLKLETYDKLSKQLGKEIKSVPQIFIDNEYIGGYEELKLKLKPTYDFEKLKNVAKINCKNLNKVIDINYYPIPEAKLSNFKHRPIGIGIQGLADTYFLMRFPFESDKARELNKQIFETIYYGALEASMELAKKRQEEIKLLLCKSEFNPLNKEWKKFAYNVDDNYQQFIKDITREKCIGAYSTFEGSPFSKGILQFDMWDIKPSNKWNWDKLKQDIQKYGTRNSLLTTLMPTASTSQILGNNECFEPITSNIYKRKTQAGEFRIINKYLIKDLQNLDLWNEAMKNSIIYCNGSIQRLKIPNDIKALYKTVWEIKQKYIVLQSAERGPFIDQSQSMNIFMEKADYGKITNCHFASWKLGLKTGLYYFRTRPIRDAVKVTINEEELLNNTNFEDNECLNCSS